MRCLLSGIIAYTLLLCGGTFAQEKSYYKVMMILFRGTTQAETGFMIISAADCRSNSSCATSRGRAARCENSSRKHAANVSI